MDTEQHIQESQYEFPYHHLVRFEGGIAFSQVKNLRWGYMYAAYLEHILEVIGSMSFESLIDVGCGDGKFVHEAHRRFPTKKIEGVDYSHQAVQFARAFSPNARFYVGDITDQSTIADTYDIATLIEVLEHIPPPDVPAFLSGIAAHLNDRGIFIVSVPSVNDPVSDKHYQHFDERSLREVLGDKFDVEKMYFINKKGVVDSIVKKILTNRFFILNQYTSINFLYRWYRRHSLVAKKTNGRRIIAICRKKATGVA